MSMVNVVDCEDCGLVVRADYQAYNRCGDCGGKMQEVIIGDVNSKAMVSGLVNALEKQLGKASVIKLLERIEADQENGDDG